MFSLSEFSDYDKRKSMILYQRNTSLFEVVLVLITSFCTSGTLFIYLAIKAAIKSSILRFAGVEKFTCTLGGDSWERMAFGGGVRFLV